MTADDLKNHALFAGGLGVLIRFSINKPKTVWTALIDLSVGCITSWYFTPLVTHYFLGDQKLIDARPIRENLTGLTGLLIGFASMAIFSYVAKLVNDSKGNPFAIMGVIKRQILGEKEDKNSPQEPVVPPVTKPETTNTIP